MNYQICAVEESEKEVLAQLRIAAMRESLETVGRFDPLRARARFVDGFDCESTRKIKMADGLAGFYVIKDKGDHFYLEHLYVHPDFQGKGIGASILQSLIAVAQNRKLPLRVGALRGSRSNQFYRSHGFIQTHEEEWDIYYEMPHCE